MDESLYDEFENYIRPEIESDHESDTDEEDEELPDTPIEDEEQSEGEGATNV